jgi:hypothetical protein
MKTRTFRVTVTVEFERTADIEIDEAEYLEWLEGDEDTAESRLDFLKAGDELDVVAEVSGCGPGEVSDYAITAVK